MSKRIKYEKVEEEINTAVKCGFCRKKFTPKEANDKYCSMSCNIKDHIVYLLSPFNW